MKKRIIIIGSVVIAIFVLALSIGLIIKTQNNKVLKVAFYEISEDIKEPLKTIIQENYSGKTQYYDLTQEDYKPRKISSKYDLFFSWNGDVTDGFSKYAKKIPLECSSKIISTIKVQKYLPILLDHYELSYLKQARTNAGLNMPSDFEEYMAYLFKMKEHVFIPFFTEGKNDDTLLGLISVQTEALCGTEGYKKLISLINESNSFYDVWEKELGYSSILQSSISLKYIMDGLSNYVANELSIQNWTNATSKDVRIYAEEKQIGVLFTSLSEHRKIPLKTIREYESDRMPVLFVQENHSLIAPAVSVVNLVSSKEKNEVVNNIIISLVSEQNQAFLSEKTMLAPVSQRSGAYDVQAQDVRYLAAIVPSGPIPDIAHACFGKDSEKKKKFTQEIRKYLSGTTEK